MTDVEAGFKEEEQPAEPTPQDAKQNNPWNNLFHARFSRRAILRGAAVTALAPLGGKGNEGNNGQKENTGSSEGEFIFLSEIHTEGLPKEKVPDLKFLLREVKSDSVVFEYTPQQLLGMVTGIPTINGEQIPNQLFQEGVLEKLAQNGTKIMFGDVDLGMSFIAEKMMLIPSVLTGLCALVANHINLKRDEVQEKHDEKIPRKTFLRKVALGTVSLWGLSPLPIRVVDMNTNQFLEQDNAIKKVLTRLKGIQSNFHPEDVTIFFRNLVMADKVLTVKQKSGLEGKKGKFGLNLGSNHGNIEDLIRAGPDFCRSLIVQYPNFFLKHVIETVGGEENFCISRVFGLPKNFRIEDLKNPDKAGEITEEKIIDEKLLSMLRQKLHYT